MTRIRLRHSRYGFMDWGEYSFEDMVAQMRKRAEAMLEEATAILEADNSAFDVDIVRGPYVQHFVRHVDPKADSEAA
jgi:hypothetical protein